MAAGERDLRITIKVRNARILRRIEAQGETVSSFCRKYQLPLMAVYELVRMTDAPVKSHKARDPDWKPLAWFLASALQCEPEDLWPEWMKVLERRRATISFDASVEELHQIETATQHDVDVELLPKLLEAVPERTREMMQDYFDGGKRLEDIGEAYGVSRSRCNTIINKGLSKARRRAYVKHWTIDGSRRE